MLYPICTTRWGMLSESVMGLVFTIDEKWQVKVNRSYASFNLIFRRWDAVIVTQVFQFHKGRGLHLVRLNQYRSPLCQSPTTGSKGQKLQTSFFWRERDILHHFLHPVVRSKNNVVDEHMMPIYLSQHCWKNREKVTVKMDCENGTFLLPTVRTFAKTHISTRSLFSLLKYTYAIDIDFSEVK